MGQPVEAEELLHGGGEEQLQRGVENAATLRPLLLLHLHLHEGPHRLPRAGSGPETKAEFWLRLLFPLSSISIRNMNKKSRRASSFTKTKKMQQQHQGVAARRSVVIM